MTLKEELEDLGLVKKSRMGLILVMIVCSSVIIGLVYYFYTENEKNYCKGNIDSDNDIVCPRGSELKKDQVEGDINTCCTAFYCSGNKESKNNVICPIGKRLKTDSNKIVGYETEVCCEDLKCSGNINSSDDFVCPDGKILIEDSEKTHGNTEEICCTSQMCYGNYDETKDVECKFGSYEKDDFNTRKGYRMEDCCNTRLCSGNTDKTQDFICGLNNIGDQTVYIDDSDNTRFPFSENDNDIQKTCCRDLKLGEKLCSNNPGGYPDYVCPDGKSLVENSQLIRVLDDGNDDDRCCSQIKCSGNPSDSGVPNYSCSENGKILKPDTDTTYCPTGGCTDDICCVDAPIGNCTNYDNKNDCERIWTEELSADQERPRKTCLWTGEGGYYNSSGDVINEKCTDYWNTDEGDSEYETYYNTKSYIYAVDKGLNLRRCELPCEPQCLGTVSIAQGGETECPLIFETNNKALEDTYGPNYSSSWPPSARKTGVLGYTEGQCPSECNFKEPEWEIYRRGDQSARGGFPLVSDVDQDNDYVYIVGKSDDTSPTYFYRCKKPCGTRQGGDSVTANNINDISITDGLDQLGCEDIECSAGSDNMSIKSMAVSNDNLWILKDGSLGLEIHSCDKNKELRTGDSNDSCILKSNWIKRDITECGDDVTGLCGRYIQKDISGDSSRDISADVDTIKINPSGTKFDLYSTGDENYYKGGLNRDIQHTNDHIYGVVMTGNINGEDYDGIVPVGKDGTGVRDIGLLGRVNKKYLPKQYHHGMEVNWEAVGGPLIGGKIKKEDTNDVERSQLNSGTATCDRFHTDTDGIGSLLGDVGSKTQSVVSNQLANTTKDICGWDGKGNIPSTEIGWSKISVWDNYDTGPQKPRRVDGESIVSVRPNTHMSGDNGLLESNNNACPAFSGIRDSVSDDNYGISQENDTVNEDYRAGEPDVWCKDECYIPRIQGARDTHSTCGLVDNRDECEATFTCAYGEEEGPDGETICDTQGNQRIRNRGGGYGNKCYWHPASYCSGTGGTPSTESCSMAQDLSKCRFDDEWKPDWLTATTTTIEPNRCWVYEEEKNGDYYKCSNIDSKEKCNNAIYINTGEYEKDGWTFDEKRKERTHGICFWDGEKCKENLKLHPANTVPHTLPCSNNDCQEEYQMADTTYPDGGGITMPELTDGWENCHKDWGNGGLGWDPIFVDEDIFGEENLTRFHGQRKNTQGSLTNQLPYCGDIDDNYDGSSSIIPECRGEQISTYDNDLSNTCRDYDNNAVCSNKYLKYSGTYTNGEEYTNYYQCNLSDSGECNPGIDVFGYTLDSTTGNYAKTSNTDFSSLNQFRCSAN